MNERVEELWEQGTQTGVPRQGNYASVSAEDIEKFAELIVKECINIADDYVREGDNTLTKKSLIGKEIAKHFGVK